MARLRVENLRALIGGESLTTYQRSLAISEWRGIILYVENLENHVKDLEGRLDNVCELSQNLLNRIK